MNGKPRTMTLAGEFTTIGTAARAALRMGLVASLAFLAACDEREVLLPGKREDPRAVLATEVPPAPAPENRVAPIRLPAATRNADWPQGRGTPATRTDHPALSAAPQLAWSAPIGEGDGRRVRITANPVVSNGRIFTLDAQALVTATSTAGETLWQTDLVPARERGNDATGGGLATGGGAVYVSSGFGKLTALDAATGAIRWQQDIDAVGNGTPVYDRGVVYIVSGDSVAWALDAENGRIRWQISSAPVENSMLGGPAPAVTDSYVILPFGTGEITAAFRNGGLRRWETYVAGRREGLARANVFAVSGDPMVVGDRVYAGTLSGRLSAMELGNGEVIWTAKEGPLSAVNVIGGSVFLVSDRNELLRLDAATGERIWGVELPFFTKDRARRQNEVFAHYGPVMAGGQLVLASNDGLLRFFDPASGELRRSVEVPGGATTGPVIAGGTLYVVSTGGSLLAYR